MNNETDHKFTMSDFNEYCSDSFEKRIPIHKLIEPRKSGCAGWCKNCTRIAVDKFDGKPYCDICWKYTQGFAKIRGGTSEEKAKWNPLPSKHQAWDELSKIDKG